MEFGEHAVAAASTRTGRDPTGQAGRQRTPRRLVIVPIIYFSSEICAASVRGDWEGALLVTRSAASLPLLGRQVDDQPDDANTNQYLADYQ
jgi:hypothetical protein